MLWKTSQNLKMKKLGRGAECYWDDVVQYKFKNFVQARSMYTSDGNSATKNFMVPVTVSCGLK